MDAIYPTGPASVPADLTRPTPGYRRHVWLAVAGLLTFVALYFLLTGWFAWTAWRLLARPVEGPLTGWIVGAAAAFLAAFMLKGLFFVKQGATDPLSVEVTSDEQPGLFAFLNRLADDARAPRPHRVFLSPRVNASVFYDLSLLNLVLASRKNLEIGLGLVNVLTLGELKAVLAHEFGHFAQRSMAVGRWVYIAGQIAAHIVARRDRFDAFLERLSGVDVRIAWVGWLMRIVVWSIRSLVETFFGLVVRMQRALSREMELQADLVAVSLTGSDALIYALHRLHAADDAFDQALGFAGAELSAGRATRDLFAVQSRFIHHINELFGGTGAGHAPARPATSPESFRIFTSELALPPRMWATHPPNHERENNAKRRYVPASSDDRSGWMLLDHAPELRERISSLVLAAGDVAVVDTEESLKRLDEQFACEPLNRRYRGAYLGRSVVLDAARPLELYGLCTRSLVVELKSLYPESLAEDLERQRSVETELAMLEALHDRTMEPPDGVIRHRGRQLRRRDLPRTIASVRKEARAVRRRISDHDRRCRSAHRAAAAHLGNGWEEYLVGLASVLHYAEHSDANIADAHRFLSNEVAIVTATGRVRKRGIKRLIAAGREVHDALRVVFSRTGELRLDPRLASRLEVAEWRDLFEEFKLDDPTEENLQSWLDVIGGWIGSATGPLGALRGAALEELLLAEERVGRHVGEGSAIEPAPPPSRVPAEYPALIPGKERKLQQRLGWWARFRTADGLVPSIARFAVAASIVAGVLGFGGTVDDAKIAIHNGLVRPVTVAIGDRVATLAPFSYATVGVRPGRYSLRARTTGGALIDSLEADVDVPFATYVYNVAGAAPLVEWTAVYGDAQARPDRRLGAVRWMKASSEWIFESPPRGAKSGTRLTVLEAPGTHAPWNVLAVVEDPGERATVIAAHARWAPPDDRYAMHWLSLAADLPGFQEIIAARLADDPRDVLTLRAEQDAGGERRSQLCARYAPGAGAEVDEATAAYLSTRCIADVAERNAAFLRHGSRWPDHGWLALAAGYVMSQRGQWPSALERLEHAHRLLPAAREALGLDIARIRRLLHGDSARVDDVVAGSRQLQLLLAIESGDAGSGEPRAGHASAARADDRRYVRPEPQLAERLVYSRLAAGRLDEALRAARRDRAMRARALRLAAASDGASTALADSAFALEPEEGIDRENVWIVLGHASRMGVDVAPYIALARPLDEQASEQLLAFHESLRRRKSLASAESMLDGMAPAVRGRAYAMGAVMLGSAAPPSWRRNASRLLFAWERPYFQ